MIAHSIVAEARPALVKVLRREEGLRLRPYLCSAGVPTIGIGATTYPDGRKVQLSDPPITERQALQMVAVEADRYLQDALESCRVWPSINQLVAMASLAYNIGVAGLRGSTVLRLHNRGDHAGAARAFGLWNKARVNGQLQPLAGLTARRSREAAMYLTPDADDEFASAAYMPQAVASESRLSSSPIAQGGGAAATGGAALGLLQVSDNLGMVSTAVDTSSGIFGRLRDVVGDVDPVLVLALFVGAAGAYVVWWRWKQRQEGWV